MPAITTPLLRRLGMLAAWAILAAGCAAPASQKGPTSFSPPAARSEPVQDHYFGTPVADPYRWLERVHAPEVRDWMAAASSHAAQTLAAIPGRDAMLARLQALDAARAVTIGRVQRLPGELYVYERRLAQEKQPSLVMRRGLDGAERVLVDPAALSRQRGGANVAVNHFSVSPDGAVLAYGVSEGGSERAVLHRLDIASGAAVGEPIDRADWGVARWSADSRHFAFTRLQPTPADPAAIYERSSVWLLPARGGWADARLLLGPDTRGVSMTPREIPFVLFTPDGRWMIAYMEDGVRREARVLVAPSSTMTEPAWTERIRREDGIVDFAYGNGRLYGRTHAGAPRFRILSAPIERFDAATAATVVPATDRVLGLMVAARDGLYFEAREGNAKQLWRLPHREGAAAQRIELPLQGDFQLRQRGGVLAAHGLLDGVLMPLESWASARRLVQVAGDGRVRDTGLQPLSAADDRSDLVVSEVLVPSHDGARVPLSILHRRGLALDGRNPTLLQGYGAYGFTWDARFDAHRLAWLERGGVIAMANPRGSGVFGQAWYEAGKQATKPNTWRDMIACAEYLIAQRYASAATLAIEGGSAGGITSGRAATERPELFAAVVPRVGVLDMVRSELEPNGRPNIPEFGSHRDEAGFRALLAMSTYHQIRDGVRYPAVMLMHGVNDPRVAVWHSSKTAARFAQAAASVPDGRPVLLRLDMDAGHGVGSSQAQRQRERADLYAFLLWQMGVAGFQP